MKQIYSYLSVHHSFKTCIYNGHLETFSTGQFLCLFDTSELQHLLYNPHITIGIAMCLQAVWQLHQYNLLRAQSDDLKPTGYM